MNMLTQAECFSEAADFVDSAIDSLPRDVWRGNEVDLLRQELLDIRNNLSVLSNAAFRAADDAMAEEHTRASVIASLQDLIEDVGRHTAGDSVLPALQECLEKLK